MSDSVDEVSYKPMSLYKSSNIIIFLKNVLTVFSEAFLKFFKNSTMR